MPGIPKKGLRHSQLVYKTAGSAVADGSHQTYRVTFIEDGVEKKAFLKKLDNKINSKGYYPELLAKISVATSLFMRIFQGKRAAEERLVFDENDQIMGTLSIDVDGFKPFNFSSEPVPTDPKLKAQVIPSTKTLIDNNFIELLFGRFVFNDDDTHPHNVSLVGGIDYDMFWAWFTAIIKRARFGIGIPNDRVNITVEDWASFPIVKDSKVYHWPTYAHPGKETVPLPGAVLTLVLPKIYADPKQFEQLAHEPEAHAQKFAAGLKMLLTYQPKMMEKQLKELFGDMTLNYTSLDKVLWTEYQEKYKRFCNAESNKDTFVKFIMGMYQEHYDNLYSVVVFYMGTKNNGHGVPLKATCETLYYQPSFYTDIEAWVKTQNETVYRSKDENAPKFDLSELKQRYHQVWRDAHLPTLTGLLFKCRELTNDVFNMLAPSETHKKEVKPTGKSLTDKTLKDAWELIGTIPELPATTESLIKLGVAKDNKYLKSLELLKEFTLKFHEIAMTYYQVKREDLTEDDNKKFADSLNALLVKYENSVRASLMHTSTYATEFHSISEALLKYIRQVNFPRHLMTNDEQMKVSMTSAHPEETLPPTDPKVIKQYVAHLFEWAKKLEPAVFNEHIKRIIDTHYAPSIALLSTRQRAVPVKKFLETSLSDGGDNRLAYIFASGNGHELNSLLIQHLTPYMLQTYPMPAIDAARKNGTFVNDVLAKYTKAVEDYAKQDNQFTHLCSTKGTALLYKTMYEWVNALPKAKFDQILETALTHYEKELWSTSTLLSLWQRSETRRVEVAAHPATLTPVERVAKIFMDGKKGSTLNQHLLQNIMAGIQADIGKVKASAQAKAKDPNELVWVELIKVDQSKGIRLMTLKELDKLKAEKKAVKEISKEQILGLNLIKQCAITKLEANPKEPAPETAIYDALKTTTAALYMEPIAKKLHAAAAVVVAAH